MVDSEIPGVSYLSNTHENCLYNLSDESVNKASVEVVPCQKMGRCGFRSGDVLLVKSGNFIFTPVPVVEEAGVVYSSSQAESPSFELYQRGGARVRGAGGC